MNQIDREMAAIERGPGFATLFSTMAAFASPIPVSSRPLRQRRSWSTQPLRHALARAVDIVLTWHERAHMRRDLLALDDRLLKDIGVTRAEVQAEVEKPFWRV